MSILAWLKGLKRRRLDDEDFQEEIRALAKNPAFSLAVVGVLTLGIGLNAAVFTMLKSMALTPLAGVSGSARLASIFRETTSERPLLLSYL